MVSLKKIEEFINSQPIALVGVSRNPKKFGYSAFKELKEKGMDLVPVNPNATEILGTKVYPDVKSLPSSIRGIIVMTKKDLTAGVVKEARDKGIKQIWIQQMAESKEALEVAGSGDINLITKECILMHYKPHSIHKFHATLRKIFRTFPR